MSRQNTRPSRLGLLAAAAAVAGTRFEVAGAGELPRPVQTECPKCGRVSINTTCPTCVVPTSVQPTFAEQLAEAIGELVDAKVNYALARRDIGAEWANIQDVSKADARLTTLLGRVAG